MVDFAFALSEYTVPADTPVIFRATNSSSRGNQHYIEFMRFEDGTTAEQVIEGQVNRLDIITDFAGWIYLETGETGDLALESLEPGRYFMICPMETADGTPHFELGMVTEITVE
jgi:uncharacterized cupredoxin-like copper-binding protein